MDILQDDESDDDKDSGINVPDDNEYPYQDSHSDNSDTDCDIEYLDDPVDKLVYNFKKLNANGTNHKITDQQHGDGFEDDDNREHHSTWIELDKYRKEICDQLTTLLCELSRNVERSMKSYITNNLGVEIPAGFLLRKYLLLLELEMYDLSVDVIQTIIKSGIEPTVGKRKVARSTKMYQAYLQLNLFPQLKSHTLQRLVREVELLYVANKSESNNIRTIENEQLPSEVSREILRIHAFENPTNSIHQRFLRRMMRQKMNLSQEPSVIKSAEYQLNAMCVDTKIIKQLSFQHDKSRSAFKKNNPKWTWMYVQYRENEQRHDLNDTLFIYLVKHLCRRSKEKENSQECDLDNITKSDAKKWKFFRKKAYWLSSHQVHSFMCHNCGYLTTATTKKEINDLNWTISENPMSFPPYVTVMFQDNMEVIEDYKFQAFDGYITCRNCSKGKDITRLFPLGPEDPSNEDRPIANSMWIPPEIEILNTDERVAISLVGCFQQVTKYSRNYKFVHSRGRASFYHPDYRYHNLVGYLYDLSADTKRVRRETMKAALKWFKHHNDLYETFYSHYETLFWHLCDYHGVSPNATHITMEFDKDIRDRVDKELRGYLIKSEIDIQNEKVDIEKVFYGTQHPKFNKLRECVSNSFEDVKLDAKVFPCEFLYAHGTFNKSNPGEMTYVQYLRSRLCNADNRFRSNYQFVLSSFDRTILQKILGFQNNVRVINTTKLLAELTVQDLKNQSEDISSNIPHTVTGSQSYFKHKSLELMAMIEHLGNPGLFITLTQNDKWNELQSLVDDTTLKKLNLDYEYQNDNSQQNISLT